MKFLMDNVHLSASFKLMSIFLVFSSVNAYAGGGVALGATRIVYEVGANQVSVPIRNASKDNTFLIQSWVSDKAGKKSADFVVTPPLFTLKSVSESAMRVIYVGEKAPSDREQLYLFSSKAIPAVGKKTLSKNSLHIAVQSEIKLFLRPKGLPMKPHEAPAALRCQLQGDTLVVSNPSPYYVTLLAPVVGGQALSSGMVEPKGSLTLPAKGARGEVKLQTVNDYGAHTNPLLCPAA
ncbi:putative fimbrial chaperone protein ElfD precursor [compost metagenome]